jgi:nicotinate phosphoribosyltransferase
MIVNSLLDSDFYKFSMMEAVLHQYSGSMIRYVFKWRNSECMKLCIPMEDFIGRLKRELDHLCSLRFKDDELKYLSGIPYFKRDFIEYLRLFQLNRAYIRCHVVNDHLVVVVEGPWLATILFEVPVLAIISQLYTENTSTSKAIWLPEARKRLKEKFSFLEAGLHKDQAFKFAEFGTRRRADVEWHDELIYTTKENWGQYLVGTSNVMLAMKYNLKPIGTVAHEWFMAHQQLGPRLADSQSAALQAWTNEYRGELGIALSDTLGFDAFLKDFDRYFALLFDGCRHDSGDPIWWAEKLIAHYKKLRIDPRTKAAIFSDGINFEVALDLFRRFHNEINVSFGIGTYLTNDCGFEAPQIVMKPVECNGRPVAKISDSVGKGMCDDPEFQDYLMKVIREKIAG